MHFDSTFSTRPGPTQPPTPGEAGTTNAAFFIQRQNPSIPPSLLGSGTGLSPQMPNLNSGQSHPDSETPDGAERASGAGIGGETARHGSCDRNRMTTWSSSNPHLPLNHTKSRRQLADAEKESMKVQKTISQAKRNDVEEDLNEMLAKHARDIEELAKKHGRKQDYINKIITNRTCYKNPRKVSLHNAIVHHKNQEVNGGKAYLIFDQVKNQHNFFRSRAREPLAPQ